MNCYVDTSVLVALFAEEPHSATASRWYSRCTHKLVASVWCVTEFASALGIKQRTGQLSVEQALLAWQHFQRLCLNDLDLLSPEAGIFHQAAELSLDATHGLRAGDALHLATALQAKAKHIATLDTVLARNAKRLKITPIRFQQ